MRLLPSFLALLVLPLAVGCQSTGGLGGTSWTVVEILALGETDVTDLDIDFGTDGWVESTLTRTDGSVEDGRRRYYVHDALLVVHRDEGDLNILHRIDGDEMVLTDEDFQARFRRVR